MGTRGTAAWAVGIWTVLAASAGYAQGQEAPQETVLFGQSAPLTGPAQQLGTDFRAGILAAFEEANRKGGVHGRKLGLLSLDDAYEPARAAANTKSLAEEHDVFALIGAVGTPTSVVSVPVAAEAGLPFIAPLTGAEFLRDDHWSNVINLRASYFQETSEIVSRLVEDLGIERIAVLYQDDSYGRAGLNGVQAALTKRGLDLVAVGVYTRNTTAVKTALLELRSAEPEAVVLIGAYSPVAAAIQWSRFIGFDAVFATISFSGTNALPAAMGERGKGVYVTQVVPFPSATSAIARTYLAALRAHSRSAPVSFVSFEGYLAGRLAIAGLERTGPNLDRAEFLRQVLQGEPINLNGFRLSFDGDDNQGSDQVFLTVIGPSLSYEAAQKMERR
jgi:ABC-type branched-subunit amino acid transport system substrate-binding protein